MARDTSIERWENTEQTKVSKKLDREEKKKEMSDNINEKVVRALETEQHRGFQQKQRKLLTGSNWIDV